MARAVVGFDGFQDQTGTNANPIDALLGPLQNNDGPVATFALLPGSPAIDRGNTASTCAATDQRGVRRPQTLSCSIGAFEPVSPQTGPTFVVNTDQDTAGDDCSVGFCSLRAAINAVNALPPNPATPYRIHFSIGESGLRTIAFATRPPALRNPVVVDGTTQSGSIARRARPSA